MAQDGPDRLGNIGRRQRRGRDLIEKRLKQVVVVAVDDGDLDGRARQRSGGLEPGKACADNHDMRTRGSHCRPPLTKSPASAFWPARILVDPSVIANPSAELGFGG